MLSLERFRGSCSPFTRRASGKHFDTPPGSIIALLEVLDNGAFGNKLTGRPGFFRFIPSTWPSLGWARCALLGGRGFEGLCRNLSAAESIWVMCGLSCGALLSSNFGRCGAFFESLNDISFSNDVSSSCSSCGTLKSASSNPSPDPDQHLSHVFFFFKRYQRTLTPELVFCVCPYCCAI